MYFIDTFKGKFIVSSDTGLSVADKLSSLNINFVMTINNCVSYMKRFEGTNPEYLIEEGILYVVYKNLLGAQEEMANLIEGNIDREPYILTSAKSKISLIWKEVALFDFKLKFKDIPEIEFIKGSKYKAEIVLSESYILYNNSIIENIIIHAILHVKNNSAYHYGEFLRDRIKLEKILNYKLL